METAPVPRLTDLKGTLNYLTTSLLCDLMHSPCWLFKQHRATSCNKKFTTVLSFIRFTNISCSNSVTQRFVIWIYLNNHQIHQNRGEFKLNPRDTVSFIINSILDKIVCKNIYKSRFRHHLSSRI